MVLKVNKTYGHKVNPLEYINRTIRHIFSRYLNINIHSTIL